MGKRVGMISLGCAKNQVNAEQMLYRLQQAGYTLQEDVDGADLVIVNTCGFIDSAKSEAIDNILAMGAHRPTARDRLPVAALSGRDPAGDAGGRRRARHGQL